MTKENSSSVLVNLDFFESRKQVGEDFVEKLVQVFGQEAPKLVRKIKSTAEESQYGELANLGHKLKGMCLNVGAEQLSDLGKEIESIARSSESEVIETIVGKLDSVLVDTLKEMQHLIDSGED